MPRAWLHRRHRGRREPPAGSGHTEASAVIPREAPFSVRPPRERREWEVPGDSTRALSGVLIWTAAAGGRGSLRKAQTDAYTRRAGSAAVAATRGGRALGRGRRLLCGDKRGLQGGRPARARSSASGERRPYLGHKQLEQPPHHFVPPGTSTAGESWRDRGVARPRPLSPRALALGPSRPRRPLPLPATSAAQSSQEQGEGAN